MMEENDFGSKRTLWTHFQEMFKLSSKGKNQVFIWMGSSLRNFRSKIANEYILPSVDKPNLLKSPPTKLEGIKKEDWIVFANKILSNSFQVWFSCG